MAVGPLELTIPTFNLISLEQHGSAQEFVSTLKSDVMFIYRHPFSQQSRCKPNTSRDLEYEQDPIKEFQGSSTLEAIFEIKTPKNIVFVSLYLDGENQNHCGFFHLKLIFLSLV